MDGAIKERKIKIMLSPEYLSLIIAALGFLASVYYSGKKSKEGDVEKIKQDTKRDANINFKLDQIMTESAATAKKVDKLQSDIDEMKIKNASMTQQHNELERRVDKLEDNLAKLHREHRENQERLINCYDPNCAIRNDDK